jgi:succinate dehydrogenase / fumarate reductase cytochrome b subunit
MTTFRTPRQTEYRNIGFGDVTMKYRMPLAAILSILRRVSGALLFLFLPFLLFLFDQSLTSELSFEVFKAFLSNIVVELIVLALSWTFFHHFSADMLPLD